MILVLPVLARAQAVEPWAAAWGGVSDLTFRGPSESLEGAGAAYTAAAGLRVGRAFAGVQRQGVRGLLTSYETDAGTAVGAVAGVEVARSRQAAILGFVGATRDAFRSGARPRGMVAEGWRA